jgi:uncharacterized membrane protein YedE/YeeE
MHPYIAAAIGGVLIGMSAVMLMAFSGRIAGISGIIGGLLPPRPAADRSWRLAFLLGLVAAPEVLRALTGDNHIGRPTVGTATLILAGLLVGAGTALGGGCTSGHGICGISRLSPRSLVAVAIFMATAVITLFLVRHVVGADYA